MTIPCHAMEEIVELVQTISQELDIPTSQAVEEIVELVQTFILPKPPEEIWKKAQIVSQHHVQKRSRWVPQIIEESEQSMQKHPTTPVTRSARSLPWIPFCLRTKRKSWKLRS